LETCVEKLPGKSRQLLELRYEDGASAEAMAEALRSTAGSVRVMLHRVRNLLAECIQTELRKEAQC
jgi:RNA polymerase sigma-70 factor (ECF subfamily)